MLTIISVSYKSKALLEMNYRLVKALNPNTPFRWIVVQNTPSQDLQNDLAMDDPRFEMIPGPVISEIENESIYYSSIHHAKALNLGACYADSDLIVTLDPDCFLLVPNWIELVTQEIITKKIVFWGVPNHPDCKRHYQGFPTVICMFINKRQLHEKNRFFLDFLPDFERPLYQKSVLFALGHHCSYKYLTDFFFKAKRQTPLKLRDFPLLVYACAKKKFPGFFHERSRDTGYQIYKRYRSSLKFYTLQVLATDERETSSKMIEAILPSSFRTFPRNKSRIRKKSSKQFEEFINDGYQFFWNDQLFAFHIQGTRLQEKERLKSQDRVLRKLEDLLETISNHSYAHNS